MDYHKVIQNVHSQLEDQENIGEVASYIPDLSCIDENKFGVCLTELNGNSHGIGDCEEKFSIQSIAKVLGLTLAYNTTGEKLWNRVGVEPSGTPFNSLVQLEHDRGIPRNPLLNAGAIVVCDILLSNLKDPETEFISFINEISKENNIAYNKKIARSEKSVGYRNRALINLMKDFGNIKNDIDDVLDFYFILCSLEMSCKELSRTFLYLANDGTDPINHHKIISLSRSKRINAIMQTCGFYDEAGEFSFRVGLPGKSGVGGGIMAIHPEHFCIAVWSPKLNSKGNSYRGVKFLEQFTTETGLSVF